MPLPYATPEDVARLLDDPPDQITDKRRTVYQTRVERASQKWDRATGEPMRTIRTGSLDRPETWEQHDVREVRGAPPVRINLDHGDIVPFDRDAGDRLEIRKGRDTFDDVTDEEGDTWVLDYRRGELKIYRFLIDRAVFERAAQRFMRITYRHGGLGGDRNRGAEAETTAAVSGNTTTLPVTDASVFPQAPFSALAGTRTEQEVLEVTAVDTTADELTVERGQEFTTAGDLPTGATVQYTPGDVREAVASKATEQVIMNDDADLAVPDNGNLSSRAERAERLRDEWQQVAAEYSGVRTL
jgi:hypothetical protein